MTADLTRDLFAERLDHVMRTIPHPGGSRWTNIRMAHALRDVGVPASAPYVSQLRSGAKSNPSASYVGAFARVLGVPVAYFYDQDTAQLDRDLELVSLLRNEAVREIAQLVDGLPPDIAATVALLARSLRQSCGLPPIASDAH